MLSSTRMIVLGGADPDAKAWRNSVVANGGTVSGPRLAIVSRFIRAEKASGAWALTDDYWGLWGESAPQALTSLKQRRLAVATNTPTFAADRDYTFDGATNYLDTGFIAASHAVAMTATSARIAVYERTNVNANTYAAGAISASNRNLRIRPRVSGNALGEANATSGTFTLPASDSRGLTAVSRNGADATTCLAYKNGAAMTRTVDPSAFGASLPLVGIFIGGSNSGGVLTTPRACAVGLVATGAALSAAQELAQYNAVQAWATAVGAQV